MSYVIIRCSDRDEVGVRQRPNANAWLARGASAPRPIRGSFLFIREVGPELRQT